jgi:trehalose 6-phosphate phosphatase
MNDQPSSLQPPAGGPDLAKIDPSQTALFLDIDGTILDIAQRPDAVSVPGQLPCDLVRLTRCLGGALALVSGRPLAAIDSMFAPLRLSAIGCHGAEIRAAVDEAVTCAPPLPDGLRVRLAALAQMHPGIVAEDKYYSFALHYRVAPEIADALMAAVEAIVAIAGDGVELLHGKEVAEVKPKGFNKGTGLRALMAVPPFHGRRPIYVGDDRTDQDALRVLPEFGGLGIGVGRALPGTAFVLDDPQTVRDWLAGIAGECA